MSVIDIKQFIWNLAVKKGAKEVVKVLIGLLALKTGVLSTFGINVDLGTFEVATTATLVGGLEVLRNWLKVKKGIKFL